MGRPENLTVPQGEVSSITNASLKAKTLKTKISLLVKDGKTFPALQEVNRLLTQSDPNLTGVYKELAKVMAKAKIKNLPSSLLSLRVHAHILPP